MTLFDSTNAALIPSNATLMAGYMTSAIDRFGDKITEDPETGCWDYATPHSAIYPQFWFMGRYVLAHRFSYSLCVGELQEDMVIDHICFNTNCVNPDHLQQITQGQNLQRSDTLQARNAAKTHCINGHEFDEKNTRYYDGPKGLERVCRACKRERAAGRL